MALSNYPSEKKNVADGNREMVGELSDAFDQWIAPMAKPIIGREKRVDIESAKNPLTDREKERERIRAQRKQQRDAAKKAKKPAAAK